MRNKIFLEEDLETNFSRRNETSLQQISVNGDTKGKRDREGDRRETVKW